MTVLVTGATGFVGRQVVKALSSRGVSVRALAHTLGREQVLHESKVEVSYGNVGDPAALKAALHGVDTVVHLVAVIREKGRATFEEVNRKGSENLVAAAGEAGVKQFVHLSALGAGDNLSYSYLYSKWRAEQYIIESGIPYTIIRPSLMFGPGDEFINTLAGLVRAFPVVPVAGSGRTPYQPLSVDDLARCVANAVGNPDMTGKVIEIGGPDQLSYNQIIDIIGRTFGVRRLKLHVPVIVMGLMVRLMEAVLPRPPATTHQLSMVSLPNIAGLETVQEVFGFSPRPLEGNIEYIKHIGFWDGLRTALGFMPAWMRDH